MSPNDSAYPRTYAERNRCLTKRELFAAMAMQGILANPDGSMVQWDEERVALAATEHADALIAELEKAK